MWRATKNASKLVCATDAATTASILSGSVLRGLQRLARGLDAEVGRGHIAQRAVVVGERRARAAHQPDVLVEHGLRVALIVHGQLRLVQAITITSAAAGSAVQPLHQRRPLGQHGALVEVALVGDLVGVDGRRLGQQQAARDAHGAALRLRVVARQTFGQRRRTAGMAHQVLELGIGSQLRAQALAARRGSGRSAARSRRGRAPSPPRPRSPARRRRSPPVRSMPTLTQVPELSLKFSAVRPSNSRPAAGLSGVGKAHGIAGPEPALLVEGLGGQLRRLEVARRDVGPLDADLELVARPAPASPACRAPARRCCLAGRWGNAPW